MPFDANLVLCDGSYDWTFARITTNTKGVPTSATSRDEGFIVLDSKAISMGPATGVAAIFICDEVGAAHDDALTLTIEGCDSTTFQYAAGPPVVKVETLASFDILGETAGVIVGDECPCTVIRRFTTHLRYIRAHAVVADASDDFHTCYVFLAPWPFHVL